VTALVALALPGEAGPPAFIASPLRGSKDELISAFNAYEELGVAHLMIHCFPYDPPAMEQVARVVQEFRRQRNLEIERTQAVC
jgi:hypothetical protein